MSATTQMYEKMKRKSNRKRATERSKALRATNVRAKKITSQPSIKKPSKFYLVPCKSTELSYINSVRHIPMCKWRR